MKDYKKILEGVVNIISTTEKSDIGFANICSYIGDNCPELAESEDERIRKELHIYLDWLDGRKDYAPRGEFTIRDMIAWLEKQGENPQGKSALEAAKEAMYDNANKVESKFHEGDWVIDNNGKVAIIYDLQNAGYVGHYTNGTDFVCKYDNEHLLHLWSINDAKDGDVLASGHLVFIFKVIHGVWLNCHCSAHNDGSFFADSYDLMTNKYFSEVHPATKEQRDLLFAKMKEAGYEWDAEKKELKKFIEEKSPVETLGISPEEYERMVNECIYGESTDKLKPKFKVGDWVVSKTSNLVYHVDSILLPQSKCYYLSHDGGLVIVSFTDEQNYHLWTIQDAKDGDVLVNVGYKRPFIYKGCLDPNHPDSPVAYCGIDSEGYFCRGGDNFDHWWTEEKVQPATKEQRDLLFAKMKESGWEWDDEKKELKMIESFNEYEGLTDFEKTLADICSGWIGNEIGWKEYIKDNANVLLRIAFEKFKTVQDTSFK